MESLIDYGVKRTSDNCGLLDEWLKKGFMVMNNYIIHWDRKDILELIA